MPIGVSPETVVTGPRRFFQRLNEKPLRSDLLFYLTIVIAASILFMLAPLIMGPYPGNEPVTDGLHRTGFIVAGILVSLVWGLITGAVALLAVSLIEHFFLLFVDVHREFEKTMKSVIYTLSPIILFSWAILILEVPFTGLLLLGCFCLLTYLGIVVFHEKSKDRAVFVSLATGAVLAIYFHRWVLDPVLVLLSS